MMPFTPHPEPLIASAAYRQPRSTLVSGSLRHLDFRVSGKVVGHDEARVPVPTELDGPVVLAQLDVVPHPSAAPRHVLLLGESKS